MRTKQKKLQQQVKEDLKQKIKDKKYDFLSHLNKPLPAEKNKTSTYNPSYVRKQKQNFSHMKQNLHLIINKVSFMALRKQVKTATFKSFQSSEKSKSNSLNPKDMISNVVGKQIIETNFAKIMGCQPNENSLSQLWALMPEQLHDGAFFIYHIQSDLFLKAQNDKVYLAPKQKMKDFLFEFIKESKDTKQFLLYEESLIIKSLLNGKCLLLRGVLGLSDMNTKSESQQFYLKKVNLYEPKKLRGALILFNPQDKYKEKAFLSLNREKDQISYSKIDYSLFQRWIFQPSIYALEQKKQQESNFMGKGKFMQKESRNYHQQTENKSKLESLPEAQISLITKATKNLINEYDNSRCQIINFKLQKSLIVTQQNGVSQLVFGPKSQKRQWQVESDGFSLKIKHADTGNYIGVKDDLIILTKSPQYWQVYDSLEQAVKLDKLDTKIGLRKNSEQQKIF